MHKWCEKIGGDLCEEISVGKFLKIAREYIDITGKIYCRVKHDECENSVRQYVVFSKEQQAEHDDQVKTGKQVKDDHYGNSGSGSQSEKYFSGSTVSRSWAAPCGRINAP